MKSKRFDSFELWPFETCKLCGNRIIPGYNVSNDIWNKIIGDPDICVCLSCFDREAQKYKIHYIILDVFYVHWYDNI